MLPSLVIGAAVVVLAFVAMGVLWACFRVARADARVEDLNE